MAEVPLAVTTVTSTVPVPAGLVATICVAVSLVIVAVTLPNFTAVAPAKLAPLTVTAVPPAAGPELGLIPVTFGAGTTYEYLSADVVAEVPPAAITVTSTVPVPAGLVATICVAVSLVIVAVALPNFTAVAPDRFVPAIVTDVPPAAGPELGLIPVTAGAGATYVNWSTDEVAEVPLAVTTVTSTVPVPTGLVATTCVAVALTIVASLLPKSTTVAPDRLVPLIVTCVPPEVGPDVGLIPVTLGAGGSYVNLSVDDVAEVPLLVTTVTSTAPAPPGLVATICVAVSLTTVALLAPK